MAARDLGGAIAAARRVLGRQAGVSEWVALVCSRERAIVGHGDRELIRGSDELELRATVHRDLPDGRGSAELVVAEPIGDAIAEAVAAATTRAGNAVGPAWRLLPPGAPARVTLADPALSGGEATDAAEVLTTLAYAAVREPDIAARSGGVPKLLSAIATVDRETIAVLTDQGLEVGWQATLATIKLVIAAGDAVVEVSNRSRSRDSLDVRGLVRGAADRLGAASGATALDAGTRVVVVRPTALTHGGGWGLLGALVAQADPALEAQGLTRYRPGGLIAAAAGDAAEPLTVSSDGAIPLALYGAPLGDGGEPVRRFALVDHGRAVGLGLGARDAALRGLPANGGVRDLVVPPGTATLETITAPGLDGSVLDVEALAWLDIELRTGRFTAGVAAATLRDDRGVRPVRGGVIRGDLVEALAQARRTREVVDRAWYHGPAAWRLPAMVVDP
jgi:predicted Zn-dependent protease